MTESDIDRSVAVIRALLTEDFDTYRQLNSELDRTANKSFAAVLGAAFVEAANRQFGETSNVSDIIRFVAEARATYTRTGERVEAEDAERMIRAALGEDHLVDNMGGRAMGAAQTAMLFAMVRDSSASPEQIDDLLGIAKDRVASYFERNPGQK
jgi:hypothetical protein